MTRASTRGLAAPITIAAALALHALPAAAAPAAATTWLIVQSAADPLALAGAAAARRAPGARVVAGSDCAGFKPGIFVLAYPADRVPPRARTAGAYAKRCTPRDGTPAALGLPAVDASFAAMREAPVNVDGADIVSRVEHGVLIRPWFTLASDDPREGVRVAVEDIAAGQRRMIERDCTGAQVARDPRYVAVACAGEQVGDAPVYRTTVYRARDLARVRVEQRCRTPRFAAGALVCDAQAIGSDGRITTRPRRVAL